ncbi:MAG: FliM/FliN family flagellar motor C-terminal domain-containing protein [Planctomycetota bacterium]
MPETSQHQRAVLDIDTPVWVTLAERKMPLEEILAIVPGSMIFFDKRCDEPLEVVAGESPVATGEAVKVGDKFGVRIRNVGKEETA